jgi:hypothetical protein
VGATGVGRAPNNDVSISARRVIPANAGVGGTGAGTVGRGARGTVAAGSGASVGGDVGADSGGGAGALTTA